MASPKPGMKQTVAIIKLQNQLASSTERIIDVEQSQRHLEALEQAFQENSRRNHKRKSSENSAWEGHELQQPVLELKDDMGKLLADDAKLKAKLSAFVEKAWASSRPTFPVKRVHQNHVARRVTCAGCGVKMEPDALPESTPEVQAQEYHETSPSASRWIHQATVRPDPPEHKRRRQVKRFSELEVRTLKQGVHDKYGIGNWKAILDDHRDVFVGRTEVDLKDKWRNLEKSGKVN